MRKFLMVADYDNSRVLIYDTPFSTDQSANVVLGQAGFTTSVCNSTATIICLPSSIAEDSAGNLYVAEDGSCRVTQFKPPFTNGMSASVVFGQADFTHSNCAANFNSATASTLGNNDSGFDSVFGAAVDSSGNLWVADSGSNRVLEYIPPFTNGMAASLVIGQADFTHGTDNQGIGASATSLFDPAFPVFDSSGDLWVADFENNRLLEYKPPFMTGMAASVVLGQADFTHNLGNQGGAVGANTLQGGNGVAFDSSGNLWVPDAFNHRVLEFKPPFTTNMAASLVLGQADFTHGLANQGGGAVPTSSTLSGPHQAAFDSSGRLIVTDANNNRTLIYAPPFATGMAASLVIGQADFTHGSPNQGGAAPTATSQEFPSGVITAH